jgi:RNA polymerase sigma-70 factor (ECF subfamily)
MMQNVDQASQNSGVERLYEDYRRPILAHLVRLLGDRETAEDLCQETFIKALRAWAQRDPHANVSAWLYRIATNTAYDHLRRRRHIHFAPLFEADTVSDAHPSDTFSDDGEPVRAALAQLPARYRVPLVLHACQEQTLQEIADLLGCSDSAVKMRLFRARARFRQVYKCEA